MGRLVRALSAAAAAIASGAWAGGCSLPVSGLRGIAEDGGADTSPQVDAMSDAGPSDGAVASDTRGDAPRADGAQPAPDASIPDGSPGDGGPTVTGILANVGSVSNATGLAMQTHLVYATHAALWWLFWIDSTHAQSIQTSYSADFVHWTQGGSLSLGLSHQGQGGNFSVAYGDLQGTDVVHLTIGAYAAGPPTHHHLHARALVSGATIVFGALDDISDIDDMTDTDPDGPATIVDPQGEVSDATGWANVGGNGPANQTVCESTGVDPGGTTWPGAFGQQEDPFVAQGTVHARAFALAGGAGQLVALCDSADQPPPSRQPSNVEWMVYAAGWSGATEVFPTGSTQDPNDWGVATLSDGHVHVLRRTLAGKFDHVRYDGVAWTTLAAPPADPLGQASGQGVVLVASGARVAAFTVAADAAGSVRMIVWNQTAWGPWATLEGSTASRGWVSGWSGAKNDAIVWTEADGSGSYRIAGRIVTF